MESMWALHAAEELNESQALYQDTNSQAAEKRHHEPALYQSTTSQAAEELNESRVLYQGATSVVPQAADYKGLGFSPCGPFLSLQPSKLPFSAASLAPKPRFSRFLPGIRQLLPRWTPAILSASLILLTSCHSRHIDMTVENRTGKAIHLLEVDYPSASFGADSLAAGELFHYRIQLRGRGPLKVQYTGSAGQQVQVEGTTLAEPQEGQIEIVLLPGGQAEFHPELTDAVVRIK
jgi:hypothetical protein